MIDVPGNGDDRLARIESLLHRLVDDQGARWPEWMAVATAARYSDLSEASIRRLLSAGRLQAHRVMRGRILISRAELDGLLIASTGTIRRGKGIRP